MAPPLFQVLVARTRTGEIIDALPDPTWSMDDALAWADTGGLYLLLPLPGIDRAGLVRRGSLRSTATAMSSASLVLARDGVALFAGPVITLGWDAAGVSLAAAGPGWLFERRMAINPSGLATPATADVLLELTPADRALELLTLATTGPGRGLPITIPAQSGDQGDQVLYAGADLRTVHEAIRDVVEADGGPDLIIQPTLSADLSTLGWVVAVGQPDLGGLNRDAVWDFPLVAIAGDLDDSETVDRAYVPGDSTGGDSTGGEEETRPIGTHGADRGDAPALERADRTSGSETRPPQLDALARSYSDQYRYAVEEITVTAPTDTGPQYRTQYNLGDVGRFSVTGHPWLDDTEVQRRIVAVSLTSRSTELVTVGDRVTPVGI